MPAHTRHARRRAFERYGVDVGNALARRIVAEVHAGRATLVSRESRTRTVRDVTVEGTTYRFVYSSKAKCIITFLTPRTQLP